MSGEVRVGGRDVGGRYRGAGRPVCRTTRDRSRDLGHVILGRRIILHTMPICRMRGKAQNGWSCEVQKILHIVF